MSLGRGGDDGPAVGGKGEEADAQRVLAGGRAVAVVVVERHRLVGRVGHRLGESDLARADVAALLRGGMGYTLG